MNSFVKVRVTKIISILVLSLLGSTSVFAQGLDLENTEIRTGYSIGVNIGLNLSNQGILGENVDNAALMQGIRDAVEGFVLLSDEDIVAALEQYSLLMDQKAQEQLAEMAQEGESFLNDNAMQAGVMTTSSGLQYLVLEESADENAAKPLATDEVEVHYHGTMIDGSVFDSSVDRGESISFPLDGVIAGWTEGLQLMKVGDKYRFFIPSDLAYGTAGAGPIAPYSTLIFEVELLGIN